MRARSAAPWLRAAPAVFVMAWGGNHFTPLLHLYEILGPYSVTSVDLFLGTYVLGLIPGLLVASALSDRHGRKAVAFAGVLVSIAASILLASFYHVEIIMCLGRMLAGISVGIGMSVGTSWIKELSSARFDPDADAAAGARRPSMTLTLGFGLGAGASGALAQWGPWPTLLPYVLHIALAVVALAALATAPETVAPGQRTGSLLADLRVPAAGHNRFIKIVLPAAPWIFATAGIAYAVIPMLETAHVGSMQLGYATLLTVVTLGTGACVQPFVARIQKATNGHALMVGMGLMLLGLLVAAGNALILSPLLGGVAAAILGASYGIALVAGLMEIQRIATASDLAGLTGVYYSLSYLGFLLPMILASVATLASYTVLLLVVAAVCCVCLLLVGRGLRTQPA